MATVPIRDILDDETGEPIFPRTHVKAVIGLADSNFFEEYVDGNGARSVKLRSDYVGLWADGWIANGGIGTGGGGGGGLIESVLGVADLDTPIVLEDLSETFSAKAIQTIWDAVKVLQNTTPNVSLVNGANNSTLIVNGTTADFYTKSQIDAIVGAAYRPAGNASSVSELGTLTATNIGKVYNMTAAFTTTADFLEGAGKSFPAGTNVVIVDAGSGTYKYDVLSGFVDLSGYAQKVVGATNGNFAGLDANGNLTDSGHKHGDYVTALGTSGNNLTWTKNGQTNNITVPYASVAGKIGTATVGSTAKPVYINAGVPTLLGTVGTSTMPVYLNNGTITQISSFREAYLSWGGKNFSGSYGPIDAAMVSELGACRTMFLKAAGIVIEYSTDAGQTWSTYEATDVQKMNLFSTGSTQFVIGHATKETASANNMLRVTMRTGAGGIYTYLNKFVIFVTTSGSTDCYCTIRCRTQKDYEDGVDTWVTRADHIPITGWSGYNVINISATTTYGNTKSSQYGEWQFIFGCTGHSSASYAGLSVSKIFGFGGVGWTTPSNMAKTGHLYAYDSLQNAIFPAAIYANVNGSDLGSSSKRWKLYATTGDFNDLLTGVNANFSGALNLTGGSSATDTTKGVNLSYSNATAHIGLSTLLGIYSSGNIVLRPNGASVSGAGNGSLTISTDGIVANEKITAEGLVSSDALTLSGSTNTARRIYFGDTNHYLELDQYGFHFSHGVYSEDFVSAGGIGNGGGSGSATELGDLVDVALTTPDNGDLLVYNSATSHWENKPQSSIIPSVSVSFDDLTSHPTTIAGYGITDANIANGTITIGANTITPITTESDPTVPSWAKAQNKPSYSISEISGTDDLQAIEALSGTSGLLRKTAANTWSLDTNPYVYEVNTQGDGFLDFVHADGNITRIDLNHEHSNYVPITRTINGSPLSQDITITAQGLGVASWAMGSGSGSTIPFNVLPSLFVARTPITDSAANGTLLGIDAISNAASSGNSDTSRFAWDSVNGAWHFIGNLYVDGWLAAGGIGAGSGGGYGVESITSNQDGTVDFHFTGGDVTTVDLNHEHPQYPKYVHLSSESEMPANPDPNTMYIIDGSGGGGGGSYTLPIASASTLGGVKVGDGLSINSNTGVLSTETKIVYLTSESQMPASPDSNTLYVILELTT